MSSETGVCNVSFASTTDITFDATKDIEGKMTLRTPISDDMIVHFSNEGSYTNFKPCLKITNTVIDPSWLKEMRKSEVTGVFRLNRPSRYLLESN
jgi:hypothetical protein